MLALLAHAPALTGTCDAKMAIDLARRWTPQFLVLESKEVVFPNTQSITRFSSFVTFCSGLDNTHGVVHCTDSGFNLYAVSVDEDDNHVFHASLASCTDAAKFRSETQDMIDWYSAFVSDKVVAADLHM